MPWYPKARRFDVRRDRGFKGRGTARPITPTAIGHHTAVVDRDDLDRQANDLTAAYPHFMIGEHGQVTQYQDTSFMARADLDGNPHRISIETWDGYPKGAPGYWRHNGDVPPWNDAQIAALIELDAWILSQHKSIPLKLANDSRPGTSSHGLSWHRLGCDGNFPNRWPYWGRRSGGLKYSRAFGKVCPGDRRITQIVDVIYPALQAGGLIIRPSARPDIEVQLALAVLGKYEPGPGLIYLDGDPGTHQRAAVQTYQRARGLLADGWWGTNTNRFFEEHDMTTVKDELATAVWGWIHGNEDYNMGFFLRRVFHQQAAVLGNQAGLLKAIEQLSAGQPVDLDAVKAAAEKGVADALAGLEADVTLTIAKED